MRTGPGEICHRGEKTNCKLFFGEFSNVQFTYMQINAPLHQLTTPENTIIYHNALRLSTQILRKHCVQTMLMQNVGVTNKEHYGMQWYFLEWSNVKKCPWVVSAGHHDQRRLILHRSDKRRRDIFLTRKRATSSKVSRL